SARIAGGVLTALSTPEATQATVEAIVSGNFGPAGDVPFRASLAVDGVPNAICLEGEWPAYGRTSRLRPAIEPRLELVCPRLLAAGEPLRFSLLTGSAPENSRLRVAFEKPEAETGGEAVIEQTREFRVVWQERAIVQGAAADGSLAVAASLEPCSEAFRTIGVMGRRRVAASLTDETGAAIAYDVRDVVIDATPAQQLILDLPPELTTAGAPVNLTIRASDDLSGITDVRVFLGTPQNQAPPEGVALISAAPDPRNPRAWTCLAPTPKDLAFVDVTAEATNGVGLRRYVTRRLELNTPAAAAVGKITGSVQEGLRAQPGLNVELRDAQRKALAKAVTDAQGKFLFADLAPGDYLVWCTKPQSQRIGGAEVKVEAGQTAKADLKLAL
ncbi:MAG: carboxypeptidase regulatory-like domain-containing protein, partial [Planctomycetales bacterium]|nr:carboxypeptidase regulatory-like domain-containing protein [Planctomycetales bacterium]